jgi:hypothetical protein
MPGAGNTGTLRPGLRLAYFFFVDFDDLVAGAGAGVRGLDEVDNELEAAALIGDDLTAAPCGALL